MGHVGGIERALGVSRGGLLGVRIGLLPLEEYLFLLIVPFWIITVYELIIKKIR
jgi:hypothetical protein